MKRSNGKLNLLMSGLLVVMLSMFVIGCDPDTKEEEKTKYDEVKAILADMGYTGDFLQPAGKDVSDFLNDDSRITITWENSTLEEFNAYKNLWNSNRAALIYSGNATYVTKGVTTGFTAAIDFTGVSFAGDVTYGGKTMSVPQNTIYLLIYKSAN